MTKRINIKDQVLDNPCGYCSGKIVGKRKGSLYCSAKCRDAEEKRRRVERATGSMPNYRGPNTSRSYDALYVRAQRKRGNKEYKAKNGRELHLMSTYGITLEQYDELFHKQDGCCYICLRHQDEFKKRLCVDHNHKTLEIRGLLCDYCNRRVIGRHTNPEILKRASEYLAQGTGWFTPPRERKVRKRKTN